MHQVLHGLTFCFVYLDDILIASKDRDEHLFHIRQVFERLKNFGLVINQEKCIFLRNEIVFLGHLVNRQGILPNPDRIKIIDEYPLPTNVQQLKRFLGMLNFYRRFIPKAAHEQILLNNFLKGYKKNSKVEIQWTSDSIKAFTRCKERLSNASILAHPTISAPLAIMVDASDYAAGAVLQQFLEGDWQPLSFFSVRFTEAQVKYSTYDRELLSIFLAIKHFKIFIEGRIFTIFTDHKPITFALRQNLDKASPRERRQLDLIAQYTTDIRHISGSENFVADALSRIETVEILESIDYKLIAETQNSDQELSKLITMPNSKLVFEQIPVTFGSNIKIYCDKSTGKLRTFIPYKWRQTVFNNFHNLFHPGIRASVKLLTTHVVWPAINKDVRKMAQSCIQCQKSKIHKHTKSEIISYPNTHERFSEIHLDIVGPLPISNGHQYLVTMIDRYTRWAEALPVVDITAPTIAFAVYTGWIARFGVPKFIVTDQGRQFESQLFHELSQRLGFQHKRTTGYHPQSNGMIERWHRSLKSAIMCHNRSDWTEILPTVLIGLRTVIKEDLGFSPAELVYGTNIRIPGEFLETPKSTTPQSDFMLKLRGHFDEIKPEPIIKHGASRVFVSADLKNCKYVFVRTDSVRKSLQQPYTGPHLVIKRDNKHFDIIINNKSVKISIDRLKPCYTENMDENVPSTTNLTTNHKEQNKVITKSQSDIVDNLSVNKSKKTVSFNIPNSDNIQRNTHIEKSQNQPELQTTRRGRVLQRPLRYLNHLIT